jgi:hypothetical protein
MRTHKRTVEINSDIERVEEVPIQKTDLDKRICDVETNATNTQTFREFIRQSEKEFDMKEENLDNMDEQNLNDYLEFLDYLWTK